MIAVKDDLTVVMDIVSAVYPFESEKLHSQFPDIVMNHSILLYWKTASEVNRH